MHKRVTFSNWLLAIFLVLPQLLVTLIFFIWPAGQALYQSVLREDAFGLKSQFVGLDNFIYLFHDQNYLYSLSITLFFSFITTLLSMGLALIFATMADKTIKGTNPYKIILTSAYAIAPAICGVLWWFLFNPTIGLLAYSLKFMGYPWNHYLNGTDALILIVIAAGWKQISYNFLFFLAGLQAIPRSLIEAAAIDGASPIRRFWNIIFPLLSPTTFFLLVINLVYNFFETFGIIHATTKGGPAKATETLVYKVFNDGFIGLNLGSSAAQSVILMIIVCFLTFLQFRFIEKRVQY
ncbi:MAG: sn-glycerol-3-phosphate ABC transporter permease UgpA [Alphaproteobacteria bacterium]|nr:sn-glycerol-3-phosphate ABC transporter permease UgpA [Alphaproteobacteria bacterium]